MEIALNTFEDAWQQGLFPRIEDWLADCQGEARLRRLEELIGIDLWWRNKAGQIPQPEEYLARFHDAKNEIHAAFAEFNATSSQADPPGVLSGDSLVSDQALQFEASSFSQPESKSSSQFGRYRVESLLGRGGFGEVYRAWDDQLNRAVAIKVTLRKFLSGDTSVAFLNEARTVAALDHPHIVPVFDVGQTSRKNYFVVSKLIEGTDLAKAIRESTPTPDEAVHIVASVADALHYAHTLGLVHRDVEPANILIDHQRKAYLTDFGIALKENEVGLGPQYVGTPAYMSPEQARGEGHRVDGRSDIFSLGVVLYELLAGQNPFLGVTQNELMEKVTNVVPRPLREHDANLPQELERICARSLAPKAQDRYSTASELMHDLQHFLGEQTKFKQQAGGTGESSVSLLISESSKGAVISHSQTGCLMNVVPKGLRSFDAEDADFFLGLLPGARDCNGLPDSVRRWKLRIEQMDRDRTFAVGLIYGPSGCGKSSLVKAGLLPRLSEELVSIYVECTSDETEARLLYGLRKQCPMLDQRLNCKDSFSALRRGQGLPRGKKLVIFLDQFEQWLHANEVDSDEELVQTLRQCDGGRVQCILVVRDDFWLPISRFFRELEVRLIEGKNSVLVDSFDLEHASKVLVAFGRAYGNLPLDGKQNSTDQDAFIKQAVEGLSQKNRVFAIRLALLAEMMKSMNWTPLKLHEVGDIEAVGVTFLEEMFSSAAAPPAHRYHQNASRKVLNALLPGVGTVIKGYIQSHSQLLAASGYANQPSDFEALLELLDKEIGLISATDSQAASGGDANVALSSSNQRYFQLTHDYLVPSLRDWLTRKQKETRKGLAELLLEDRSAVWNSRPENRQLVSLMQWIQIRCYTNPKKWTLPQCKMMSKASRVHCGRLFLAFSLMAVAAFAGFLILRSVI